MENLLQNIEDHKVATGILLISVLLILYVIKLILNSFGLVAHSDSKLFQRQQKQFVILKTVLRTLNQFRHILAILVIACFLSLIVFSVLAMGDKKMDAFQLTLSSFSGILGTIVGFYFSEKYKDNRNSLDDAVTEDDLQPSEEVSEPIKPLNF